MKLSKVKKGDTFKIGNIEFIKFGTRNGNVTAVTKDVVFNSKFGKNNNFAESLVLNRLQKEFLPKIENAMIVVNLITNTLLSMHLQIAELKSSRWFATIPSTYENGGNK